MSSGQPPQQSSSSTWTEPPWCGWIENTGDALLILEAARRGLIPRVTRRLVDAERKMITSGSVFVFDEDESGIKRWTDGFFWSPSRILGNFLLYRETDKRGAGHRSIKADQELNSEDTLSLSRPRSDSASLAVDKHRERSLVGSLTNSYKFKPDGLVKKTFSLSIEGVAQHLISYYKIEDVENGRLRSPSSLPELASLDISPQYLDKTHFRNPPKVEIGVDGIPRYRGEADDLDTPSTPSTILTGPLSSSSLPPLLTEGRIAENSSTSKRGKRFDPYNSSPGFKRPRKNTKSSHQDPTSPTTEGTASPVASTSSPSAQATQPPSPPPHTGLPEASAPVNVPMPAAIPHGYPAYGMPAFYPGYPPPPPGHLYGHPSSASIIPSYPPPPAVAVAPVTSTTYVAYPGYSPASAGPLTSANLAPTSSTTATTTVTTTTQLRGSDLSQAGPGPSPSSHLGLAPTASAHSGQGYPQTQPQYYSYYPPPSHPAQLQHGYSHTPVAYQWHQYSAYAHPPPNSGPHHPQASLHTAHVQSQQHIGMARDIQPRNEEGNIEEGDSV